MAFGLSTTGAYAPVLSFGEILSNAPSLDESLFTQVPVLNQQAFTGLTKEVIGAKAITESERIRADTIKWQAKQQEEAQKKAAAVQLLGSLGSFGSSGGSGTRMAGSRLAALMPPMDPAQQLQTVNGFLDQADGLGQRVGNLPLGGTSASFAQVAMKGQS